MKVSIGNEEEGREKEKSAYIYKPCKRRFGIKTASSEYMVYLCY